MYTKEDLASAVRAGVLTDGTASAFREHVVTALPAATEMAKRKRHPALLLLLLSAFWHPSRAAVVRRLRPGLRAWLLEFR